ncbi:GGDEF domain-containing protein [Desulfovibrio sp. OttesenSCG-928-F07]|nr:GGDEF domain-containing protein [Desulfovibrio sp. OttesenSCG-928-F07]
MAIKPKLRLFASHRTSRGALLFMRMFIRWLSPSDNMRMLVGPSTTPSKALELFSAYLFSLLGGVLTLLLLFIEFCISGSLSTEFLPLLGLLCVSLLTCYIITTTYSTAIPTLLLSGYIFCMCGYYLLAGVADENFLFYYFWVPPCFVFCMNSRTGGILSLAFILGITIAFSPEVHQTLPLQLSAGFRIRFVLAMLCMLIVSFLAELIIQKLMESIYNINARLENYSLTDPLTGIGNRRNCINQFQRLHAIQIRSGEPFSIIMIDMDYFKSVNDTYGHMLGDDVLRFLSETLIDSLRQQDSLFRWGGEEFIMLLPGTNIEQAEIAAERLRKTIAETPFEDGEMRLYLTASLGVYTVTTADEMEEHLKRVDKLLYQAKSSGRNTVISARELKAEVQ